MFFIKKLILVIELCVVSLALSELIDLLLKLRNKEVLLLFGSYSLDNNQFSLFLLFRVMEMTWNGKRLEMNVLSSKF